MTNLPQAALFIGFNIETSFAEQLKLVPPDLRSLFIHKESKEEYLQEIDWNAQRYLGKFIKPSNLSALELLEKNIYTLLQKLVPHYPYNQSPLTIFPVVIPA